MNKLRMALPLVVLGAWLVGAGCDDDRGVVDLGAGGDVAQHGGSAGKLGSGGGETALGGAGAGGAAGAGGQPSLDCPSDVLGADGTPCAAAQEGDQCSDEDTDDPCGLGQSIICESGRWRLQEAFPSDCGGAGGQAGGGAGGQAGGGAGGAP